MIEDFERMIRQDRAKMRQCRGLTRKGGPDDLDHAVATFVQHRLDERLQRQRCSAGRTPGAGHYDRALRLDERRVMRLTRHSRILPLKAPMATKFRATLVVHLWRRMDKIVGLCSFEGSRMTDIASPRAKLNFATDWSYAPAPE